MARRRVDRDELFGFMRGSGVGPRAAARHFQLSEGTILSLVGREKRENAFPEGDPRRWGRLNGYQMTATSCSCPACVQRDATRNADRARARQARREGAAEPRVSE